MGRANSFGGVLLLSVVVAIAVMLTIGASGNRVEAQSLETVAAEFAAESMSWSPSDAARVKSDSNAQGGSALAMLSNSTASKFITTSEAVDKVVVRMRGNACEGYAKATLKIDDTTVGTKDVTNDVSGGPYADYTYNLASNLEAGSHTVKVEFANDLYQSSSCDRNLIVDHVTLRAAPSFAAESMNGIGAPSTEIRGSTQANDGKAVAYWGNDTLSKSVTTSEQLGSVVLRQRANSCDGYARSTLKIDGTTVETKDVTNNTPGGPYSDYTYKLSSPLAAGTHTIEVQYANDYYESSSCDRNLHLDHVTLKAPTTTQPPPGTVSFSDTFDRDADTFQPPWDEIKRAASDRITTDTFARKGTHSAKFAVHDGDVAPLTYTGNPRAQLTHPEIFCEGDERWIGWSLYFPSDFPAIPSGGWLITGSHGFAPPYDGSSPGSFTVRSPPGDKLMLTRDESHERDAIWQTPLQKGEWMDLVAHIKFSRDGTVGYVELWLNGARQTFSNGKGRIYYPTLKKDSTGCGDLIRTNYRMKGMVTWLTIYHDEVKVGNSYEAVAP